MSAYKFVNADQLDADLTAVADSIRAKGGTTGELEFPAGFQTAVAKISTGIEVKRTSGTLSLKSGSATVNCGFRPDLVMIHQNKSYDNANLVCAVSFTDDTLTTTLKTGLWDDGSSVIVYAVNISQNATGFSVSMTGWTDLTESTATGTFQYSAVKFT